MYRSQSVVKITRWKIRNYQLISSLLGNNGLPLYGLISIFFAKLVYFFHVKLVGKCYLNVEFLCLKQFYIVPELGIAMPPLSTTQIQLKCYTFFKVYRIKFKVNYKTKWAMYGIHVTFLRT